MSPTEADSSSDEWPSDSEMRRRRWVANLEENRKKAREYYANNREKIKAHNQAWRERNPDKVKSAMKAYAKANPEKIKAITNRYRRRHPEMGREASKRYQAKIAGPGNMVRKAGYNDLVDEVIEYAGGVCQGCGAERSGGKVGTLCVHHLDGVPTNNVRENLMLLCRSCHVAFHVEMREGV